MNPAAKVGVYALGLAVVLAGAIGVGNAIGPDPKSKAAAPSHGHDEGTEKSEKPGKAGKAEGEGGHGGHAEPTEPASGGDVPGGLQIAEAGYRLVPDTTTWRPGRTARFGFTIEGPDGHATTKFDTVHEKKVHFIVARRDLSGFQHLHPAYVGKGRWEVPLKLADPGTYRVFADFKPTAAESQLTLGTDLIAPGNATVEALPKPAAEAVSGAYTVRVNGSLRAGRTSRLQLHVEKDGRPVTDLQPYLGASGHLVALRSGDLAYLHVHPNETRAEGGPVVSFDAEVPSRGAYRLYLDFKHANTVHTAEFTMEAR